MAAFESFGIMPEIVEALEEMDWLLPTPVQDEAIPLILGGGDVMIAAETGSGKTGAFAIPLLQTLYETLRGEARAEGGGGEDAPSGPATYEDLLDSGGSLNIGLSTTDRQPFVAISPNGLQVQSREALPWGGARANVGVHSGRFYYEAVATDEGLCRIGWSTAGSNLQLGQDGASFGFGGTAKKSHNSKYDDYGQTYTKGDTVGAYVDFNNHTIFFSKNGKTLGTAFNIPPHLNGQALYPAVCLKNAEMKFNFGGEQFNFEPLDGYLPLVEAKKDQVGINPNQAKPQPIIKEKKKKDLTRSTLGIVIEPTQDLASQVFKEINKFKKNLDEPEVKTLLATAQTQHGAIKQGLKEGAHVIVGTLGRLHSMIHSREVDVSDICFLVIDEADSLLDLDNKPKILDLYKKIVGDHGKYLQVVICSATLHSPEVAKLADEITKHPTWVDLKGKDAVPELVDHIMILVDPERDRSWEKGLPKGLQLDNLHSPLSGNSPDALSYGIKILKPLLLIKLIDTFKFDQCLIFCRTRLDCENLEAFLTNYGGGGKFTERGQVTAKENPYSALVLHGGKGSEREANLEAFREGDIRFLICTDVAARGIDIKQLPAVINMTMPDPSEQYIHRIGRVGRAGAPGLAISLVSNKKERVWWHECKRSDRGLGCRNTKLREQGGCTIWFDELNLKEEVENRLSRKTDKDELETKGKMKLVRGKMAEIPFLTPTQVLENSQERIRALAKPPQDTSGLAEKTEALTQHAEILKPAVDQLRDLEIQAQYTYWNLNKQTAQLLQLSKRQAKGASKSIQVAKTSKPINTAPPSRVPAASTAPPPKQVSQTPITTPPPTTTPPTTATPSHLIPDNYSFVPKATPPSEDDYPPLSSTAPPKQQPQQQPRSQPQPKQQDYAPLSQEDYPPLQSSGRRESSGGGGDGGGGGGGGYRGGGGGGGYRGRGGSGGGGGGGGRGGGGRGGGGRGRGRGGRGRGGYGTQRNYY